MYVSVHEMILDAYADPESVVRGGPTLTFFFFGGGGGVGEMRGEKIQVPLYAGHHRPASETPLNGGGVAGVPMMAQQ